MHTTERHAGDGHPHRTPAADGEPRRTPAGDVILRPSRAAGSAPTRRGRSATDRTGSWLRLTALLLGVVAFTAALVTGVALANGGRLPDGGGAAAGHGSPTSGPPATTGTEFRTGPIRPYPSAPPTDGITTAQGAGGISAARARVAGFVAALNDDDFDRANGYLCAAMAGSYDESSLDGIVPGTLGVGGVSLQGDTGTAVVTYRPTGSGDPGHAIYGLVVENNTWMLCNPR